MLLSHLDLLATAPGGVARLRELILTLAVQGKLVPQDPADEPASELLQKIRVEKERLIAEGKIRRGKPLTAIAEAEKPFELPQGWEWASLARIGVINPRNEAKDEVLASFVQMSSIPVGFSATHLSEPRPWKTIKSGFTQFAEGDVGVAKITPCFENGKSTVFQNLRNGIGAGTTELHIVRPLGDIEPRYVLLFLKTPAFLKEGEAVMTGSAGQKRLPRSYFECKPFPLPPLAEQSRIVTRVDELMRLCDALEAKGQLEAKQHAQLVSALLGTLTFSSTPDELAENWHRVAQHFDVLLDRPEAVDALEQTILQLAMRGLLVPQDPSDQPASVLLQKIRVEKDRLIAEGKIKRDKPLTPITNEEKPFKMPVGWEWANVATVFETTSGGTFTPEMEKESGTYMYVKVGDMNLIGNETAITTSSRFVDPDEKTLKALIPSGSIIFPKRGGAIATNKKRVVSKPIFVDLNTMAITPIVIPTEYALMWLMTIDLASLNTGTSVPQINHKDIDPLLFPLPPLAEQSRIVTRVTELRRLCAELRLRLSAAQATQTHLAQALLESATSV